jgi:hypothetical protein
MYRVHVVFSYSSIHMEGRYGLYFSNHKDTLDDHVAQKQGVSVFEQKVRPIFAAAGCSMEIIRRFIESQLLSHIAADSSLLPKRPLVRNMPMKS